MFRGIFGRDVTIDLGTANSEESREAASVPVVAAVRETLDRGIVLAGGGALLRHLDERLRRETGLPVHMAEDPLRSVALGSGRSLGEVEFHRRALSAS